MTEESIHTDAYTEETPGVDSALADLKQSFSLSPEEHDLLMRCSEKALVRVFRKNQYYSETVWPFDVLLWVSS